ncbi:MAG TPA: hypothetical protein VK174_02220 [Chitinophagales bacterium]|nr:hypothetical protein [Chitinophagales bacterium]
MTAAAKIKMAYSAFLSGAAIAIWHGLYSAQFLEYDDNWGSLITIFLLSLVVVVALIAIAVKWRYIIKFCFWQTALYLLIASPATVVFVTFNYPTIFHTHLQH